MNNSSRREYLLITTGLTTLTAGCTGNTLGEVEQSDLSEPDRQGYRRYKEAYDAGQENIKNLEDEGFVNIFQQDTPPEKTRSEWQNIHETVSQYSSEFSNASSLFEESRQLSESSVFNQPTLTGEEWMSTYSRICGSIREIIRWHNFDIEEWDDRLPGYDNFNSAIAEEPQKPMSPSDLLESAVNGYSFLDQI